MPTFRYEARNIEGHDVAGVIAADDERLALRDLRQRGLTAFALSTDMPLTKRRLGKIRKPGIGDYILALKQMGLLLEAGVTLDQTLQSMMDAPAYRSLGLSLEAARRDLRHGASLSAALQQNLPDLPAYVHRLVEAGELTGHLRQAIADAAAQMETANRLAKEIRNALVYPAVLVFSGVAAVLFIFVFVVPRFTVMVKNRADSLPWLSKVVLNTGGFFNAHWAVLAGGVVCGVFLIHRLLQVPAARAALYEAALRLPIAGLWLREAETGRWSSMFATLLSNRVPLVQSMNLARAIMRSERLQASLSQVERAVRGGSTLAKALEDYTVFDATIVNLVSVGERSGNLAVMLRSAAMLCEENGRDRMKRFLVLIEPFAILIIGVAVGTIVIAIFLAVSSIGDIPL
jgi:general secretion pathway protein F